MDFPSVLEQLPNGTVGIVDHIKVDRRQIRHPSDLL